MTIKSTKLSLLRYQLAQRAKRIGQAWRLAIGRSTKDDALDLLYHMQEIAEQYSLSTFDVKGVIDRAQDLYEDHPELEALCSAAAQRVAHKWSSTGDEASAAIDWAMDLVVEYAADDGVMLVELNEELEEA